MFLTDKDEIWKYLTQNFISLEGVSIDNNGVVHASYIFANGMAMPSGFTIPELKVQFGDVTRFRITHCGLTTLKGCLKTCYLLDVSNNKLTSLEYCTQDIKEALYISHNHITNIDNLPRSGIKIQLEYNLNYEKKN